VRRQLEAADKDGRPLRSRRPAADRSHLWLASLTERQDPQPRICFRFHRGESFSVPLGVTNPDPTAVSTTAYRTLVASSVVTCSIDATGLGPYKRPVR
jgi:hypothetical protein